MHHFLERLQPGDPLQDFQRIAAAAAVVEGDEEGRDDGGCGNGDTSGAGGERRWHRICRGIGGYCNGGWHRGRSSGLYACRGSSCWPTRYRCHLSEIPVRRKDL